MMRLALRRCFTQARPYGAARLASTSSRTSSSPLDAVRANILNRINGPATKPSEQDQEDEDSDSDSRDRVFVEKRPPSSPNFYTTRPVYHDQVAQLERAIGLASNALRRAQLLPLPPFARASLLPIHPVWKSKEEMSTDFRAKMTLVRYRKVTKLLNELNGYYRIASTAGATDVADKIFSVVSLFEIEAHKKEEVLARLKKKPVVLDAYGRSYTFGKRKTSSARVWMIPQQESSVSSKSLPTTTILVNNMPLNEYFALPADREKITRPLRIAGVLGKYNIFAIVRGGGTTGQSGALSHGISKGLVAHEKDLETLFRKAKLTRRDPRMVERKKTGLAKARKRYTWVKR